MKVGDLVRVKSVEGCPTGIVVSIDDACGWPWVMIESGELIVWPENVMEKINESR